MLFLLCEQRLVYTPPFLFCELVRSTTSEWVPTLFFLFRFELLRALHQELGGLTFEGNDGDGDPLP